MQSKVGGLLGLELGLERAKSGEKQRWEGELWGDEEERLECEGRGRLCFPNHPYISRKGLVRLAQKKTLNDDDSIVNNCCLD